jgi:hypothetical protein
MNVSEAKVIRVETENIIRTKSLEKALFVWNFWNFRNVTKFQKKMERKHVPKFCNSKKKFVVLFQNSALQIFVFGGRRRITFGATEKLLFLACLGTFHASVIVHFDRVAA